MRNLRKSSWEREGISAWDTKPHTGWRACGDYKYMKTAESYCLPKHLVDMVRAMVINDDLYEYCKELAEVYGGVAGKSGENA